MSALLAQRQTAHLGASSPSSSKTGHPLVAHRTRQSISLRGRRRGSAQLLRAGPQDDESKQTAVASRQGRDNAFIWGTAAGLTGLAALCGTVLREPLLDLVYEQSITDGGDLLGAGDIAGGLLWALSLYYASPLQLLLLFLGELDTSRPSDAVLRFFGEASGQPVDAIDYKFPPAIQALTVACFLASGMAIAALFRAGLGDATWSVSSGIGSCIAAGVYEVGRPQRLSVEDAQKLESHWQDFAAFASKRLQKMGRAHESEIYRQFRRENARYRSPDSVSDEVLRDMVRNWHPDVDRTSKGFFKNLSLRPGVDAFGQPVGSGAPTLEQTRGSS